MRRKDREVMDPDKIREIISACHCCRLGLVDEGRAYIVPLSFGYTEEGGHYTFYFHGAKAGRKIELMRKDPCAGFEMDTNYRLNEDESACEYSARFQSVIGSGRITFIEEIPEKEAALNAIMRHNTGRGDWEFPEKTVKATCVFRLDVEEMACKEHL